LTNVKEKHLKEKHLKENYLKENYLKGKHLKENTKRPCFDLKVNHQIAVTGFETQQI
jgi:hypothetical protein